VNGKQVSVEVSREDEQYYGGIENEKYEGSGMLVRDGLFFEGLFSKGHFVYGRITKANGTVSEGYFKDD
jgi:hypothetical protein